MGFIVLFLVREKQVSRVKREDSSQAKREGDKYREH